MNPTRIVIGLALAVAGGAVLAQEKVQTEAGPVSVEELAGGLEHPWGMAFLPDGRLLVTERAGTLRVLDSRNQLSDPLKGTPEVLARGQGGMLDVALDPAFEENQLVYLSFAEGDESGSGTALGRGELVDGRIRNFEVIFRQEPKVSGTNHYGGRIVFAPDGTLFLTLGDRFKFDPAQDLSNHLGTVVRLNRDGTIPTDNPFLDKSDARDAIWSYGHRNIEGAAIHPESDELWVAEMGPKGGDELNKTQAGHNYGWPTVSWGDHYDGREIPDPPTHPEFADAAKQWTPVIAPSGMMFYTADKFPKWQGDALIGGLASQAVIRVSISGDKATEEERIALGARIRDVEQAPDGSVYLLTDESNGGIWRLAPGD
ncbi:MAG: hypothetical protein CL583_18340 [Alteromonadaceae bacterium]|nr:hypothetical protein [Alteromonadaceae bacterium]